MEKTVRETIKEIVFKHLKTKNIKHMDNVLVL